ncbi:MAG: glycosyltransferase [Bacteroidia bacterium]
MQHIVIFGPGPRFKGGISNFTTSLANSLHKEGAKVSIVSWSQQYPAIIPRDFVDKASKRDLLEGRDIQVQYLTNYNNPFSWYKTAKLIASLKPDIVIFQWAIAIQGLPMGIISRKVKDLSPQTEILFDVHNVVQKENGKLDRILTRFALKSADSYIMHGQVTIDEFSNFLPEIKYEISDTGLRESDKKTIIKLFHPVYDMFKPKPNFDVEAVKLELGLKTNVFLFFGFIRKYKGLHYAIESFATLLKDYPDSSLLIVGESFWDTVDKTKLSTKLKQFIFNTARFILLRKADSEQDYKPLALIKQFGIESNTVVINRFVPNEEVYKYFQVSDAIVNFYEYATPSGVESIAYNFNKPILATAVGHFRFAIIDSQNGYLANAADVPSMALAMKKIIENPISKSSIEHIAAAQNWKNYSKAILRK